MSGLWEAQLVVAACALPEPLVAALLRVGAKAVVCRQAPSDDPVSSPQPSPEAAIAFFEVRALIGEMLNSLSISCPDFTTPLSAGGKRFLGHAPL